MYNTPLDDDIEVIEVVPDLRDDDITEWRDMERARQRELAYRSSLRRINRLQKQVAALKESNAKLSQTLKQHIVNVKRFNAIIRGRDQTIKEILAMK